MHKNKKGSIVLSLRYVLSYIWERNSIQTFQPKIVIFLCFTTLRYVLMNLENSLKKPSKNSQFYVVENDAIKFVQRTVFDCVLKWNFIHLWSSNVNK